VGFRDSSGQKSGWQALFLHQLVFREYLEEREKGELLRIVWGTRDRWDVHKFSSYLLREPLASIRQLQI